MWKHRYINEKQDKILFGIQRPYKHETDKARNWKLKDTIKFVAGFVYGDNPTGWGFSREMTLILDSAVAPFRAVLPLTSLVYFYF